MDLKVGDKVKFRPCCDYIFNYKKMTSIDLLRCEGVVTNVFKQFILCDVYYKNEKINNMPQVYTYSEIKNVE